MKATTHLIFALFLAVVFFKDFLFARTIESFIFIALLIIGATLPDFDIKNTWFKHRGLSHSIFVPIALLFVAYFYLPAYALVVGTLSHGLADALTPMGWKPFTPFKFKIKGPIKTGSLAEILFAAAILFVIFGMVLPI